MTQIVRTGVVLLACMLLVACGGEASSRADKQFASESRILSVSPSTMAPRATQAVRVTVQSSVVSGPTLGYYTYTYDVHNEHNSSATICRFGIASLPEPDTLETPDQWMGFYGYQDHDSALVWAVIDTVTAPPAAWDSLDLYSSPFEIQVNETKTFKLVSRWAPTAIPSVTFYAQGFAPSPEAESYTAEGINPFPTLFDLVCLPNLGPRRLTFRG